MRDRHDNRTLDLFPPAGTVATAATLAFDGLAAALSLATTVLCKLNPAKHRRFADFEITAKGALSEDEKSLIFDLADSKGLAAWTIAKRIGRHPSTVSWLLTNWGFKRLATTRKAPFRRGGQIVMPFSPAEDAYMRRRSTEGATPAMIRREMATRFPNHLRSRDTISCRLRMLASDEAAREMAA